MPLHTRLDAVLAAGLARPVYRSRASLPTGMAPESMEVEGGEEAEAARSLVKWETEVTWTRRIWEVLRAVKKKKVAQAKYDAVLDDVLNARMDLVRATAELQNKLREVASVYGIPPDQAGTWVMNEVRKMREAGFRDGSKILQLLKAAELPRGS